MSPQVFFADAVLFDMDGTLTDSIAAVEAAWGKVAKDIGQDPAYVIAATHGKRAVDNLAQFKPHIRPHEMDIEVQAFEQSILDYADAFNSWGPGSASSNSAPPSTAESTPELSEASSATTSASSSARSSFSDAPGPRPRPRRPSSSFATTLERLLSVATPRDEYPSGYNDTTLEDVQEELEATTDPKVAQHIMEAWKLEAAGVDRSIQILPGVKRMLSSLPEGRYAVATSGAKTYAYGAMTRVGITPPPVTITACDKRLKAGKPAPDPFLLAAECLGFDAKKCVVFEDSPSGIRAGVASGATVIAVCTSHARSKIEHCGAHYIVENMEQVHCEPVWENGVMSLRFTVDL